MIRFVIRKLIAVVMTVLILIYLILEELLWERIAEPAYRFLHGLKLLQRLEGTVQRLNRYAILFLFLILFVIVEGLGIIAIALFANGLPVVAAGVYAGKIPITVITFWLFRIAKEKLMTFAWFKWCYDGLQNIIHAIKSSQIYVSLKARMHNIKVWLKGILNLAPILRLRTMMHAIFGGLLRTLFGLRRKKPPTPES